MDIKSHLTQIREKIDNHFIYQLMKISYECELSILSGITNSATIRAYDMVERTRSRERIIRELMFVDAFTDSDGNVYDGLDSIVVKFKGYIDGEKRDLLDLEIYAYAVKGIRSDIERKLIEF